MSQRVRKIDDCHGETPPGEMNTTSVTARRRHRIAMFRRALLMPALLLMTGVATAGPAFAQVNRGTASQQSVVATSAAHTPAVAAQQCNPGFSQTLNTTPFYTQQHGVVWLGPCTGLYVQCYIETSSPGLWTEWVSWTTAFQARFSGWVDDIHIQTWNNYPWKFWRHC